MAGWQQTIIVGNVGRAEPLKYLQSGVAVFNFSVAVNEVWTDTNTNERKEKTLWFRVAAWRRLAETMSQYVQKGGQVMVIGTIEARAYTDNSGQPAVSLELTARDIRLLGSRQDRENVGEGNFEEYGAPPDNTGDIPF